MRLYFAFLIAVCGLLQCLAFQQGVGSALQARRATAKMTMMSSESATSLHGKYKAGTLGDLVTISHDACDILAPMIKQFYDKMAESKATNQKLKADASYFTIVDGIVQKLIVDSLFCRSKFLEIVGEEDDCNVNITTAPFTVDDLIVPAEFNAIVEQTRDKIAKLSEKIDPVAYKLLTVFVDPIDGTREFATGKGEYCSMLIGYNSPVGLPVAGIIYRPLTNPPSWAAGAASENVAIGQLNKPATPNYNGVLVSDGKNSPFLIKIIDDMNLDKVPSFASGNRALMLIEGKAGAYIRDTGGFSKWDCSGPQAVLEAHGGIMAKLPKYMTDKKLESYTYLKTRRNLDFDPDLVTLTLSNAKNKKELKLMEDDQLAEDVDLIKEYACVEGLLAFNKEGLPLLDRLDRVMSKIAITGTPPLFT